jgi:hypothetical protein
MINATIPTGIVRTGIRKPAVVIPPTTTTLIPALRISSGVSVPGGPGRCPAASHVRSSTAFPDTSTTLAPARLKWSSTLRDPAPATSWTAGRTTLQPPPVIPFGRGGLQSHRLEEAGRAAHRSRRVWSGRRSALVADGVPPHREGGPHSSLSAAVYSASPATWLKKVLDTTNRLRSS